MKMTRVYQCEDTLEGIFTAVYDAGKSRYGHDYIQIQVQSENCAENLSLFQEYVAVQADSEKVEKVLRSIRSQISEQAYRQVLVAAGSNQPDKADVIYHFIVYGFAMGRGVVDALHIPCVQRMFEIKRRVYNEAHFFIEFLRFQEIKSEKPVLFAVFEPENDVIAIVTNHFADRLSPERFIIYDKTHRLAAFHSPEDGWYLRSLDSEEGRRLEDLGKKNEEAYADLWKAFFESISIKERENRKLQRNNLALHYRKHMTEFQ